MTLHMDLKTRYVPASSVVTDRQTDRQTDRTTTVPLAHAPKGNSERSEAIIILEIRIRR